MKQVKTIVVLIVLGCAMSCSERNLEKHGNESSVELDSEQDEVMPVPTIRQGNSSKTDWIKLLKLLKYTDMKGYSYPSFVAGRQVNSVGAGAIHFGGDDLSLSKQYPMYRDIDHFDFYTFERLDLSVLKWYTEYGNISNEWIEESEEEGALPGDLRLTADWKSDKDAEGHFTASIVSANGMPKLIYRLFTDKWKIWSERVLSVSEYYRINELMSKIYGRSDTKYYVAEKKPEYRAGGERGFSEEIHQSIVYPQEALKDSIVGLVSLWVTVGKDGTIENVRIKDGIHPSLDEEAVRLVKNARSTFSPALIDNHPVKFELNQLVWFELDSDLVFTGWDDFNISRSNAPVPDEPVDDGFHRDVRSKVVLPSNVYRYVDNIMEINLSRLALGGVEYEMLNGAIKSRGPYHPNEFVINPDPEEDSCYLLVKANLQGITSIVDTISFNIKNLPAPILEIAGMEDDRIDFNVLKSNALVVPRLSPALRNQVQELFEVTRVKLTVEYDSNSSTFELESGIIPVEVIKLISKAENVSIEFEDATVYAITKKFKRIEGIGELKPENLRLQVE